MAHFMTALSLYMVAVHIDRCWYIFHMTDDVIRVSCGPLFHYTVRTALHASVRLSVCTFVYAASAPILKNKKILSQK